jgi:hypothetical protein
MSGNDVQDVIRAYHSLGEWNKQLIPEAYPFELGTLATSQTVKLMD